MTMRTKQNARRTLMKQGQWGQNRMQGENTHEARTMRTKQNARREHSWSKSNKDKTEDWRQHQRSNDNEDKNRKQGKNTHEASTSVLSRSCFFILRICACVSFLPCCSSNMAGRSTEEIPSSGSPVLNELNNITMSGLDLALDLGEPSDFGLLSPCNVLELPDRWISDSSLMSLSWWRWSDPVELTPEELGMLCTESVLSTFLRSFSSKWFSFCHDSRLCMLESLSLCLSSWMESAV